MTKYLLALRDKKAEMFMSPFLVPTLAVAYRDIASEVARGGEGNQLALFSKDFDVYQLGNFDLESGELDTCGFPQRLCNVGALVAEPDRGVALGTLDEVSERLKKSTRELEGAN